MAELYVHAPNGITLGNFARENPELLHYSLSDFLLLLRTSGRLITNRPLIASSSRRIKERQHTYEWRVTGIQETVIGTAWSFFIQFFHGKAFLSDRILEDIFTTQGLNPTLLDSDLVAFHHFYPRQNICERFCNSALRYGTTIGAWYYNLDRGVVPALQTSKRCSKKDCGATYHHNYVTFKGSRYYYNHTDLDALEVNSSTNSHTS